MSHLLVLELTCAHSFPFYHLSLLPCLHQLKNKGKGAVRCPLAASHGICLAAWSWPQGPHPLASGRHSREGGRHRPLLHWGKEWGCFTKRRMPKGSVLVHAHLTNCCPPTTSAPPPTNSTGHQVGVPAAAQTVALWYRDSKGRGQPARASSSAGPWAHTLGWSLPIPPFAST